MKGIEVESFDLAQILKDLPYLRGAGNLQKHAKACFYLRMLGYPAKSIDRITEVHLGNLFHVAEAAVNAFMTPGSPQDNFTKFLMGGAPLADDFKSLFLDFLRRIWNDFVEAGEPITISADAIRDVGSSMVELGRLITLQEAHLVVEINDKAKAAMDSGTSASEPIPTPEPDSV